MLPRSTKHSDVKIFVHDIPNRFNFELLESQPQLAHDFWAVEHQVHVNLLSSPWRTDDPAEADYFFVPFYSMCDLAAILYRRGVGVAKPGIVWRKWAEFHVRRHMREVLGHLHESGLWNQQSVSRHIFVFGQGRGPNQARIWQRFPEIRDAVFLGVEANPRRAEHTFSLQKDLVIPAYEPWVEIIDRIHEEPREERYLAHFRGRAWGEVRPALFEHLQADNDILITEDRCFDLGGEGTAVDMGQVKAYYRELRQSRFCLCPAGWTPWSRRFYEAILVGSIPVLIPGTFAPPLQRPHRLLALLHHCRHGSVAATGKRIACDPRPTGTGHAGAHRRYPGLLHLPRKASTRRCRLNACGGVGGQTLPENNPRLIQALPLPTRRLWCCLTVAIMPFLPHQIPGAMGDSQDVDVLRSHTIANPVALPDYASPLIP